MRDIETKVDGSSTLPAAQWNSNQDERERAITSSGLTLDPAAGPDSNPNSLAEAIVIAAQAGQSYQDTGTPNVFVLGTVGTFEQPTAYFDGMTIVFKSNTTNSGNCTVNVSGIGAISLRQNDGTEVPTGRIEGGRWVLAIFESASNQFQILINTTPLASSPDAPDQVATYVDTGSVSTYTLTAETGYITPTSYSDQMVAVFKTNATNNGVGAQGIKVGALASKTITNPNGSNLSASQVTAGNWIIAAFRTANDRFELVSNSTPDAVVTLPSLVAPYTASGTNGISLTVRPGFNAPPALVAGLTVMFQATNDNTGAVTLNVEGLGFVTTRFNNLPLEAKDIEQQSGITAVYDGTVFDIISNTTPPRNIDGSYTDSGNGTTYILAPRPGVRPPSSYVEGMTVRFFANNNNTENPTVNVNGLGAIGMRTDFNTTLQTRRILAGEEVEAIFDGTVFRVVGGISKGSRSRGTVLTQIIGDLPGVQVATPINFLASAPDLLGLYDAASQTLRVPSDRGITRLDVSVNVLMNDIAGLTEDMQVDLVVEGVIVGTSHSSDGVRTVRGYSINVEDVFVSGNSLIEAQFTSTSGTHSLISARLSAKPSSYVT